VAEIADRQILSEIEFEIAAPRCQDDAAHDARRPDDIAVHQTIDVLEHRIALLAAAADRGERIIAQHQSIRPLDPGKAQPIDGLGDDGGISGDGRGQRHRLVARAGTDAADIGSGIAIKDRAIFGKGDRAGGSLSGCQSESSEPRSTSSIAARVSVKGTRSSTTALTARRTAWTPSLGASIGLVWPVPTAASVAPSVPARPRRGARPDSA
jgi:hypothetical protein